MTVTQKVDVRDIPLAQIHRNTGQPRKMFDQEALNELAESIRQHGVIEPVVVRPVEDGYELIAGERRWRASQLADADTIPARILQGIDDLRAFELAVLENVNREDMTVIEEAEAYQQLANTGRTYAEVAGLFGKTESYVKWRTDLLTLTDDVAVLVGRGDIKPNLAWYIAKLSPAGQHRVAAKYAKGDFPSEWDAQAFAEAVLMQESQGELLSDGLTEEERQERRKVRRSARTAGEKVDGLVAQLDRFATMTPTAMYEALEGELGTFYDRLELLGKTLAKTKATTRRARAIADATAEAGGREQVAT